MTTVIDPAGTPVPVYNRSGKTIVSISDSRDGTDPALQLTQYSERTFYEITFTYPGGGSGTPIAELPSNADVGDEIYIHFTSGASMDVAPPSGETLRVSTSTPGSTGGSTIHFIKIASDSWRALSINA
jgi:hypothetical protein